MKLWWRDMITSLSLKRPLQRMCQKFGKTVKQSCETRSFQYIWQAFVVKITQVCKNILWRWTQTHNYNTDRIINYSLFTTENCKLYYMYCIICAVHNSCLPHVSLPNITSQLFSEEGGSWTYRTSTKKYGDCSSWRCNCRTTKPIDVVVGRFSWNKHNYKEFKTEHYTNDKMQGSHRSNHTENMDL